jgi:hypothetical protein
MMPLLCLHPFIVRTQGGDEAHGEIAPPAERRWQIVPRLAYAEAQQAMTGISREMRLQAIGDGFVERKFILQWIETQKTVRCQGGNERARHEQERDFPGAVYLLPTTKLTAPSRACSWRPQDRVFTVRFAPLRPERFEGNHRRNRYERITLFVETFIASDQIEEAKLSFPISVAENCREYSWSESSCLSC